MNGIQKFEMWLGEMDNRLQEANKKGVPLMVEEMEEEQFPLKWLSRDKEDTQFYAPKENKYPNGYMEKIEYWLDKVERGRTAEGRAHAKSKVLYFLKKEMERA